jgi:hypothetical protein
LLAGQGKPLFFEVHSIEDFRIEAIYVLEGKDYLKTFHLWHQGVFLPKDVKAAYHTIVGYPL